MRHATTPALLTTLLAVLLAALLLGGCGGDDRLPSDGDDPFADGSIPLFLSGDAQAVGSSPRIATVSCEVPFRCPLTRFDVKLDAARTSDPAVVSVRSVESDLVGGVQLDVHRAGEATITIEYSYVNSQGERRYGTTDKRIIARDLSGVTMQELRCWEGDWRRIERSEPVTFDNTIKEIALFEQDGLSVDLTVEARDSDRLSLEGMTLDALMRQEGAPVLTDSFMAVGGFQFMLHGEAQTSERIRFELEDWSLTVHRVTPAQIDRIALHTTEQLRLFVGDVPVCLPTSKLGDEAVRFESETPEVCQWSREDGWSYARAGDCQTTATYAPGRGGRGVTTSLTFEVTEAMLGR